MNKLKIAFVTGSSKGIGKEIAKKLYLDGFEVFINGRDKSILEKSKSDIQGKNPREVYTICADLTQTNNIRNALLYIKKTLNQYPDVVVANIGSGSSKPGWNVEDNEWDRMITLNFLGSMRICRESINFMKESGGSIICISSIAGCEAIGAPLPYAVSKTALISFVKNFSREIPKNVRINSISPGNVYFDGGTWDRKLKENKKDVIKYIEKSVPLKSFVSPLDIANMVSFLVSDSGRFIHGTNIIIDGGQTRKLI